MYLSRCFVSKDVELSSRFLFIALNHLYHIYTYIHTYMYMYIRRMEYLINTSNFCLSKNDFV